MFVPGPLNDRIWHLGFNRIDTLNEQLVRGREDLFFGWEFEAAAKKLPAEVIAYYVGLLSDPDTLRGSFGWYRALDTTIAQDQQRKGRRLTIPMLAIGGAASFGDKVAAALGAVADDVQGVVLPATGHFVAEEFPEELLTALTDFLAPYRSRPAAVPPPRSQATG
ncbi:MAG: alpha/beta fold hydrolase, partial [Blastococcus sp.]